MSMFMGYIYVCIIPFTGTFIFILMILLCLIFNNSKYIQSEKQLTGQNETDMDADQEEYKVNVISERGLLKIV